MKSSFFKVVLVTAVLMISSDVFACTSAIFTGKVTPDGRPLLWKHRDTGELNNRIQFYKGEKYDFIALVNSPEAYDFKEAWSGTNTVGFSIMNTASYNLNYDNVDESKMDREGEVMWKALSTCRTLKDFEKMLDKMPRPIGVESNFGVIDAEGGAAYYEVSNQKWVKVDVNDPRVAPMGYLTYTNHSYTGKLNDGSGYERYTNSDNIIKSAIARAERITPEFIFTHLDCSYNNEILGLDLVKENSKAGEGLLQRGTGFFVDQDFIPRRSTSAMIIVKGVKPGENPLNTVMWTMLGYPATATPVPVFVKAGENQPVYMVARENKNVNEYDKLLKFRNYEISEKNSVMCDYSLLFKKDIFCISRGNGKDYFNFNKIYNPYGTGYMQQLSELNSIIFREGSILVEKSRDKEYDKDAFNVFYDKIGKMIIENYTKLLEK